MLDMCGSSAYSFNTLVAPHWVNAIYPTYGNQRTCSAQGFLIQLSLGGSIYNACICVYYLLTVRYRMDKRILERWALPVMHVATLLFSFGSATAALVVVLDLYHYRGVLGCWINDAEKRACHCDYGSG
jgi:hypothetical protein